MSIFTEGLTNIDQRVNHVMDQPEERMHTIAVLQLYEIGVLQSLVELMALGIPREHMPDTEGFLLDVILEEQAA